MGVMERCIDPHLDFIMYFISPFWQTSLGGTMEVAGKMIDGAQNIFFAQLADPATTHFNVEATRFMAGKFHRLMCLIARSGILQFTVVPDLNIEKLSVDL